jgi:transcriptional regulator with XRE-family HTH domain/predicted Fe-S protein YdhL (DUF1289 family)
MDIEIIPLARAPRPGDRYCTSCHRHRPERDFFASGHGQARRRICTRCLHDQKRRERIARGGRDRHPRYNARGEVWCNRCDRYQGAENFKRHPSRPHTYWSYCKVCTRELDRERYARKTSTLEGAQAVLDSRLARNRRQRRAEFAERRKFLKESIQLLRRRGLTKAEIVRLTDTTHGNLLNWERGATKRPTKAVCDRFAIVVRETAELPLGEPIHRRRIPHPAMSELLARCLPKVRAIPLRDSWKNRRRA